MSCIGVLLLSLALLTVGTCEAKRHLLEEHIRTTVDNFASGQDDVQETTKPLSRMLLAFHALGNLKDKSSLLGQSSWKEALLDNEKLNLMGLKDFKKEPFSDSSLVSGATDAAGDVVQTKQDFISKIAGVATGDLTLEQAAAGQVPKKLLFVY